MTWPPCGSGDCPVPEPREATLRRLRTYLFDDDAIWWRGSQVSYAGDVLIPGDKASPGRFSPLPETNHAYLGATRTVAILESVLHRASGTQPRIYLAEVQNVVLTPTTINQPLRFVDLRNPELDRLGIPRSGLVATTPRHYPCTRAWAAAVQNRRPGGHQVHGIIWHSRQADAYAQAHREGLIADLLSHRQAEVAVLWSPNCPESPMTRAGTPETLLDQGRPSRLLIELSALIQAPIE